MDQSIVDVGSDKTYPVVVGAGLDLAALIDAQRPPGPAIILTDDTVGPLHASTVRESLRAAGWSVVEEIVIPTGETSKSFETYTEVIRRIARADLTRDGAIFALGGGVVGDLGGFVAGTYMRGIDLVMLPTSLLAMVDSSVGGKTGVDLPEGKNLAGVFIRPRLVAADLKWLDSLPDSEISHGLAEVIKMGFLAGGDYFAALDSTEAARHRDTNSLTKLILHAIRFKAEVVAEDEHEAGRRAILNYGHTIGHGLEAAANYGLPHGEAVAIGMIAAARLSEARYGANLLEAHHELLTAASLPTSLASVNASRVLQSMSRDKKRRHSADHRFVLLREVGDPMWDVPVTDEEALQTMETLID
jgi:3-dehydroquinate synthase